MAAPVAVVVRKAESKTIRLKRSGETKLFRYVLLFELLMYFIYFHQGS